MNKVKMIKLSSNRAIFISASTLELVIPELFYGEHEEPIDIFYRYLKESNFSHIIIDSVHSIIYYS